MGPDDLGTPSFGLFVPLESRDSEQVVMGKLK